LLLMTHGLALLVSLLLPLAWPCRLALASLVAGSLYLSAGTHLWRHLPFAIREVRWSPDGYWTLVFTRGERRRARLLPRSYVHPRLVILSFRIGRWRLQHLLLTSDNVDATLLRRLRVRLRAAGSGTAAVEAGKLSRIQ
jgi:toxin CptA